MQRITGLAAALMLSAGIAQASTVSGGTLTTAEAADLETWLGVGNQDFTAIFTGDAGVASAAGFHAAADGAGPTFSVYTIELWDGSTAKIGGYTDNDWGANSGYTADSDAFIFNLTTGEVQTAQVYPQYATLIHANHFPTFGGGHDLYAGYGTLGQCGSTLNINCDGYSYSHSYDQSQGQIAIAGDSGYGHGDSGHTAYDSWSVRSLEVYTFAPSATVPLPASGLLMLTGLGGLAALRRRRRRR